MDIEIGQQEAEPKNTSNQWTVSGKKGKKRITLIKNKNIEDKHKINNMISSNENISDDLSKLPDLETINVSKNPEKVSSQQHQVNASTSENEEKDQNNMEKEGENDNANKNKITRKRKKKNSSKDFNEADKPQERRIIICDDQVGLNYFMMTEFESHFNQ